MNNMKFDTQMEQAFNDIFGIKEDGFKVIFNRYTLGGSKQKERKFKSPDSLQRWMASNLDSSDGTIALVSLYDFGVGEPLVARSDIEAKEYLNAQYGVQ